MAFLCRFFTSCVVAVSVIASAMAHNSLPSSTLCLRRSQPAFIDAAPKFLQCEHTCRAQPAYFHSSNMTLTELRCFSSHFPRFLSSSPPFYAGCRELGREHSAILGSEGRQGLPEREGICRETVRLEHCQWRVQALEREHREGETEDAAEDQGTASGMTTSAARASQHAWMMW
eukprot:874714-Rhodomonas_salina.1